MRTGGALAVAAVERQSVLIIDDRREMREELARMLEDLGYTPFCAESPFEGVRLAQEMQPSLVLCDVVMPTWDGFKVAALIKSQARFVPVIMLTSLNDIDSKRRGQAAGADDFLTKPVSPIELKIRIEAMLRIKALTDQLEVANRRLAEMADTDALTKLYNRRYFDTWYATEVDRARRYGRPLGVVAIDIDYFKKVNDAYGHGAGDDVLRAVADCMQTSGVRRADRLVRLGGEEFVVVAVETELDGLLQMAERLRSAVEALRVQSAGQQLQVTISLGVAGWSRDTGGDPTTLLADADAALYTAKRNGRNRVIAHRRQA
jgi:two-component system cell cycle response regulator